MKSITHTDDVKAIKALITRQFSSLNWSTGTLGDWRSFAADFFSDAILYPAVRPPKPQTVAAFVERMQGLSETKLRSFKEAVLGNPVVHVFGNVAVAVSVCEVVENDHQTSRSVEMLLLLKTASVWQIVAQAWDTEDPSNAIPEHLIGARD